MAEAVAVMSVTAIQDGEMVVCGECGGQMTPFLWHSLIDPDERALFWRCLDDSDHVTRSLPLGHLRIIA